MVMATEKQKTAIRNMCDFLSRKPGDLSSLSVKDANRQIKSLIGSVKDHERALFDALGSIKSRND